MDYKKVPKSSTFFICEKCDYNTSRESQFIRHMATDKHKRVTLELQKGQKSSEHICDCGKHYKHRQGLWKHRLNCLIFNNKTFCDDLNEEVTNKILHDIIKQKDEIIKMKNDIIDGKTELINEHRKLKELTLNQFNNNTNYINSNNTNNFNLQFFLNVQCKDALNISEFIDTLNVSISDLEETGRLGFVEGVSKIFINGLTELDINKRPIHCSDLKRETIYVKDKDVWQKEELDRNKIKQIIKGITNKNIKKILEWQKLYPDYNDSSSKTNDKYLQIVSNVMNGSTEEETQKNYNKIIAKIAKETVIQK